MRSSPVLERLFQILPGISDRHAPGTPFYDFLAAISRREVEMLFSDNTGMPVDFQPFGRLVFPYERMGAVDSLNLMALDEIIMFSFYWANRGYYRNVLDIGANLGLHSILLCRCGYTVECYEPDPVHFRLLMRNLELNEARSVKAHQMAVSDNDGEMEFVRVLGNTTGSHLAGSKVNPYGDLQRFTVGTAAFRSLVNEVDLLKLDVEGHEKTIFRSTVAEDWARMDGLISVHDAANAQAIFAHGKEVGLAMFSQKIDWRAVVTWEDLPLSHHEGTLFVTRKAAMPWQHREATTRGPS